MAAPTSAVLRDSAPPLIEDVYRAAYAGGAGGACRRMLALREELQRSARIPVVGERSRGKSRLINAMLRRPGLLPVAVDVASNVFVVITHAGEGEEHVEVRFGTPGGRRVVGGLRAVRVGERQRRKRQGRALGHGAPAEPAAGRRDRAL